MNVIQQFRRLGWIAGATALTACGSNPPLLFADYTSFGLQLGTEVAGAGGSVTLGYKARSVAVVPVSAVDIDGSAKQRRSSDADSKDALSVFASFESASGAGSGKVELGQLFATGIAAQELTNGYKCKLSGNSVCAESPPAQVKKPVGATSMDKTSAAVNTTAPERAAPHGSGPYQRPLVYVRSDIVGIDIGGTAAEQGVSFALGYASRNLALVPSIGVGADGKPVALSSEDNQQNEKDTFSVLGQFNTNTVTSGLGFNIGRYFATGIAAQNLAQGLKLSIARSAQPAPLAVAGK